MGSELAVASQSVDPVTLGSRLRDARTRLGLTQRQLASGLVSGAYLSRIEAGKRRPGLALLGELAARLNTDIEALVFGTSIEERARQQLELDYAELELASGSAEEALIRLESLRDGVGDLAGGRRVRIAHARALEAVGRVADAIGCLEELVHDDTHDAGWLMAVNSLGRCYREAGDLGRAVHVCEWGLKMVEAVGLRGSEEGIQLAMTAASAYFERGDTAYAVQLCHAAANEAEKIASPAAQSAVYWNASVMESRQGNIAAAMAHAQKALALYETSDNPRNRARLLSDALGEDVVRV